ncbi:hypothetical protein ABW636_15360 [Aquimarina sp. 2201CG1-2-11]|uniref:hypothetical protein n=1 Tax=Aquimarina discodermiae TaxID=3231043 RepID=UPI00346214D0
MNTLEKERIVKKNVLDIFKENFDISQTDDEILNIIPEKEFNPNYVGYYESILDIFLLEEQYFESITGRVKDTILRVTELWDTLPYCSANWDWRMQ